MILWRIAPVADPRDSRWQDRRIWREVIVRAPSAAMARLIAGRLETNPDRPPVGNESPAFRSGFTDEKLYWVARLSTAEAAAVGEGGAYGIVRAVPADALLETPPPSLLPERVEEPAREPVGEPVEKAAE
ncbi:hypothetical protein [Rhodospirillaceae bacterium SYSU D60014]|uniref:hypothetical protein n=1 Tax=Virgifigura deserti TaxID=2268457 RepID=UPI000E660297